MSHLRALHRLVILNQQGATAVEYGLMIALIALAIVGAVTALGLALPGWFQPAADGLS